MKKISNKVLKAVECVSRAEAEKILIWPPVCMGLIHQPKRPKKK